MRLSTLATAALVAAAVLPASAFAHTGNGSATAEPLSLPAVPQETGEIQLTVVIVDELTPRPVPLTDSRLVAETNKQVTTVIRTDEYGMVKAKLLPGEYSLESVRPVRYKARSYTWRKNFRVEAGQFQAIKLSDADAEPATGKPREEPAANTAEATPAAQLPDAVRKGTARRNYDESGLAHPFRLSFGGYQIGSTNSAKQFLIDASGADKNGFATKLDYSFFRPTRHEAMVSAYFIGKTSNVGASNAYGVGLEYRFRFANEGKAYYGLALGYGQSESGGDGTFLSGSALGIEFGKATFAEFRYLYSPDDELGLSLFMVGVRF